MSSYIFSNNPVFIGSDHAGFEAKREIILYLKQKKVDIIDKGTFSYESCDYSDFAHEVATSVSARKDGGYGILLCGSANGVAMTANKYPYIRAAVCWNEEITLLARKHNNANIICLPSRFRNITMCIDYINLFFTTAFEGGRHQGRIDKIDPGHKNPKKKLKEVSPKLGDPPQGRPTKLLR